MRPDRRAIGQRLQRGVIIIPSALTLANLFFGVWAIVAAGRRDFTGAAWLVVFAAIADTLDGRVARVTKTGSRFGEELDSLVDAISFGVAPAVIIYHLFLFEGVWSWVASFIYVAGAVIRLARFNIEQAGQAKFSFHGLPSPASGVTLAAFYPFSQTAWFQEHLSALPWSTLMTAMTVVLAGLMMSHVLYPVMPKFGFRTWRGIFNGVFMLAVILAAILVPSHFFFPFSVAYVLYGILKSVVLGFMERLPDRDMLLDEEEEPDEAGAELREIEYDDFTPPPQQQQRYGGPTRAKEAD